MKRFFDVVVALFVLMLSMPLLLIVIILVRINMGAPVLFRQVRPGYLGKPFTLFKLRSMSDMNGPDGELLPPEQRLTRLGKLLRVTSIDELPQLWNVIRGDMSLVGPRPLKMEYLPLYTAEQARRNDVLPGITGWAQVNGRNAISWEEKFKLDVWYVDHRSFWLDMKILWLTLRKVLKREGLNFSDNAVSSPFRGTQDEK